MVTLRRHASFLFLVLVVFYSISPQPGFAAEKKKGYVARAMFSTGIVEREPVDQALILDTRTRQIYFFSDIRNMEGQSVIHHWKLNGKLVSKKEFPVKGPRWRIYSQKDLSAEMTGIWTVTVTDDRGWPMKIVKFQYIAEGQGKTLVIPVSAE